jgi:hypothetical protein
LPSAVAEMAIQVLVGMVVKAVAVVAAQVELIVTMVEVAVAVL